MSDAESEETFDALLEDAIESLGRLEETVGESEAIDDLDDDTLETVVGDVDTLVQVAEEVGELLEAMDLSDLPEAVGRRTSSSTPSNSARFPTCWRTRTTA